MLKKIKDAGKTTRLLRSIQFAISWGVIVVKPFSGLFGFVGTGMTTFWQSSLLSAIIVFVEGYSPIPWLIDSIEFTLSSFWFDCKKKFFLNFFLEIFECINWDLRYWYKTYSPFLCYPRRLQKAKTDIYPCCSEDFLRLSLGVTDFKIYLLLTLFKTTFCLKRKFLLFILMENLHI